MEKKKKVGGDACAAINCTNSRAKFPEKGFVRFPKNEERCRLWIQNMRRKDLIGKSAEHLHRSARLCSDHFENSQFRPPCPGNRRGRLVKNAVPTLFDVPNPPAQLASRRKSPKDRTTIQPCTSKDAVSDTDSTADEQSSMHQSSPPSTLPLPLTPRKKKLKRLIRTLQNKLRRNKDKTKKKQASSKQSMTLSARKKILLEHLPHVLPSESLSFIETQIKMAKTSIRGRRWSENDKAMALSLLHSSPKSYRILQQMFVLPSVTTLRLTMQKVSIYPGFNEHIIEALKSKVSLMSAGSELCAVVFDEMSIKESVVYNRERDEIEGLEDFGTHGRSHFVANHATVFMARGLLSKWKQVVGYVLSSGTINSAMLQTLLFECIDKLTSAGLNVKVIIADQGPNNRKMFETLCGVTDSDPFFVHKDKKIFVMYDPPHLIKNIRNNLKKSGFAVGDEEIRWSYVTEFYHIDSRNQIRLAPKLTYKHISLPPFAALSVKLATQVLSHTVAAGISTLSSLDIFPKEAEHTADFIEKFDQLFNAFNSGSSFGSAKMRHALSETSGHQQFLRNALKWLAGIKSHSSGTLPCLMGWKMAINTLLSLWNDLHINHKVKFLYTDRLNQDCIENLFSIVRGKGIHSDNPSSDQFRQFLRQIMVDSLLTQSKVSNCEEDQDTSLLTLSSLSRKQGDSVQQPDSLFQPEYPDIETEHLWHIANPDQAPPDRFQMQAMSQVITYIAGYVVRKLKDKVCPQCTLLLKGCLTGGQDQVFLVHKQYDDTKGEGLMIPSQLLVRTIQVLETAFVNNVTDILVKNVTVKRHLTVLLEKEASTKEASLSCPLSEPCPLLHWIVQIFLNVRLKFFLKDNTKSFSAKKAFTRKNRKIMKVSHV